MKKIFTLLALIPTLCWAQPTQPVPPEATAAQVTARSGTGYVSARRLPAGGGGDALTSNPLSQFAATTSAQLASVLTDETGYSSGAISVFNINPALTGYILAGAPAIITPAPMTTTAIDVTKPWLTRALAGDETETFSATPTTGAKIVVAYTSDGSNRTVTAPLAGAVYFNDLGTTGTTFTVPASTTRYVTWSRESGRWVAYGTGVLTSGGGTSYLLITPDNTVGKTLRVTGTATAAWGALDLADTDAVTGNLPLTNTGATTGDVVKSAGSAATTVPHQVSFTITGSGSALTTGVQDLIVNSKFGGTVTVWSVTTSPADTITFDILRSADSGLAPSSSIVGAGTKPNLASGVNGHAAPSSWTSTAITAFDNFKCQITAVGGVCTSATVTIYFQ